jgi:hypothetical protein
LPDALKGFFVAVFTVFAKSNCHRQPQKEKY